MDAELENFSFENLEIIAQYNSELELGHGKRIATDKSCEEGTLDKKELYYLYKIINPTKTSKIIHYTPVLWEKMDGGLVKPRFNSFRILLYSRARSSVMIVKHMQKL